MYLLHHYILSGIGNVTFLLILPRAHILEVLLVRLSVIISKEAGAYTSIGALVIYLPPFFLHAPGVGHVDTDPARGTDQRSGTLYVSGQRHAGQETGRVDLSLFLDLFSFFLAALSLSFSVFVSVLVFLSSLCPFFNY